MCIVTWGDGGWVFPWSLLCSVGRAWLLLTVSSGVPFGAECILLLCFLPFSCFLCVWKADQNQSRWYSYSGLHMKQETGNTMSWKFANSTTSNTRRTRNAESRGDAAFSRKVPPRVSPSISRLGIAPGSSVTSWRIHDPTKSTTFYDILRHQKTYVTHMLMWNPLRALMQPIVGRRNTVFDLVPNSTNYVV